MPHPEGVVRSISWRDICPWTELFRVFRISVSIQMLLLGFAGVWAMSIGWTVASRICLDAETRNVADVERYLNLVTSWPGQQPAPLATELIDESETLPSTIVLNNFWQRWLVHTPIFTLVEPVKQLFMGENSWRQYFFFLIGGLWNLLVWSMIGGAITRIAAVRLGRDERVGLRDSLLFATSKIGAFTSAPLVPLLAIALIAIPLWILGLVMRLDLGVLLGSVLWGVIGLFGFTMVLFAIGVLFGWPLMWSAISTEGSDAFDAISRSYAYTYQRPLHYLIYVLIAFGLGCLGWLIVNFFCNAIVQFTMVSVGSGMGPRQSEALMSVMTADGAEASRMLTWGGAVIGWFNRCFLGFQRAYEYSFLWTAAAGIYLLLRRDADQTEMDEVYVAEDEAVVYGLPPIKMDESGVPIVEDAPPTEGQLSQTDSAEDEPN